MATGSRPIERRSQVDAGVLRPPPPQPVGELSDAEVGAQVDLERAPPVGVERLADRGADRVDRAALEPAPRDHRVARAGRPRRARTARTFLSGVAGEAVARSRRTTRRATPTFAGRSGAHVDPRVRERLRPTRRPTRAAASDAPPRASDGHVGGDVDARRRGR